ncbi:MAG: hypothetical protein MK160_12115 [Rhodobacteraceae bacterium]|nr:hypothetical protein [Paracoccaceae bacterium]
MRRLVQPGPAVQPRIEIGLAQGVPIDVTLAHGIPLEEAVAKATEGFDSAWLALSEARVDDLSYVVPARSPDPAHVAWYSEPRGFDGPGTIERLGMIVGKNGGASFLHGHGLWTPDGGDQVMGHILAPHTILAAPVMARGIGLRGAGFERRHDPETNFDLFQVCNGAETGDCAAVRLRPNQDFSSALQAACAQLGWAAARVHGLGSLVSALFECGTGLDSEATEFLITEAQAGPDSATPEIVIVGLNGDELRGGRVTHGENAILITAELVLERL